MGKYIDGIHEERFDAYLSDLRSGDYNQGKGALHLMESTPDGDIREALCCLGVACLRPAAEGFVTVVNPDMSGVNGAGVALNVRYDGYNTVDLPLKVADYLGIPEINRIDHGEGSSNVAFLRMGYNRDKTMESAYTAIGFNDTLNKTFNQIADAFEAEFVREENNV